MNSNSSLTLVDDLRSNATQLLPPPINYDTKPGNGLSSTGRAPPLPARKVRSGQPSPLPNVFDTPIGTSQPEFSVREHTLLPKSIVPAFESQQPIQTNKFYSNLYLGTQKEQIYPLPYVLKWSGRGLDIDHRDADQLVFGPDSSKDPVQFFYSPVKNVSLSFTATEDPSVMSLSDPGQFSINLNFSTPNNSGSILTTIVRGSAFIAAQYHNLTPQIDSGVYIRKLERLRTNSAQKWRVTLEDGKIWLVYATGAQDLNLILVTNGTMQATSQWSGLVQIAKLPANNATVEPLFDQTAGTYPTRTILSGAVSHKARYRFDFNKTGDRSLLMYALPHHVKAFTSATKTSLVGNKLASPTSGAMSLVAADYWEMEAPLPAPSQLAAVPTVAPNAMTVVKEALQIDANDDFDSRIRTRSMYFSGKQLNKLAQLTALAKDVGSPEYEKLLPILDRNVLFFVRNQQQYGLLYEKTWGGIVSIQGFTDRGNLSDFGNTWYNDHHFHFGYHISSVALWLRLFPNSTARAEVQAWATSLVRDVASPKYDQWFPAFRNMDWFVGHSWAKGLFESPDGKDEESSSEDYHFTYATYQFAIAVNDTALRDRSLIQLAVQKQSMRSYMLYEPNNRVEPRQFVRNWVSGIRFENKIDHTTYFGSNEEYIHGIQMLPLTPISSFIRTPEFVKNEWYSKLQELVRTQPEMEGAWKSLIYASLGASVEGQGGEAWKYFNNGTVGLDSGATRAWYLALLSTAGTSLARLS